MRRISRAQIELTRGTEETRISNDITFEANEAHVQKLPMWPLCFMRVAFQTSSMRDSRLEASNTWSSRFKNMTRVASSIDETRVFINKGCVFSCQHWSMSPLLQLVQQYTGKTNQKLYQFNSTSINKPELIQVLDWVFKTFVMIFPGGFKQFNSTLMKTRIQIRLSSDISKDCQSNHREPEINLRSKVFQNMSQ